MFLCTGSSGSIGKRMTQVLDAQIKLENSEKEMFQALSIYRSSVLIHLAAPTNIGKIEGNYPWAKSVIVDSTLRLMRAFAKAGGRSFVFASTGHVYGPIQTDGELEESQLVRPVTNYAKLKYRAEMELLNEADELDIEVKILRIFSVFGSKMAPHYLASRVYVECASRDFRKINNSEDVRDFSTPEYVADSIQSLASRRFSGIVNICSGIGKTIEDRVLQECPHWPLDLFDKGNSELPRLVGSTSRLKELLTAQR